MSSATSNVGETNWKLGIFTGEMEEGTKRASNAVDVMCDRMAKSIAPVDDLLRNASRQLKNQSDELKRNASYAQEIAAKADKLNQGRSGSQNMNAFNASIKDERENLRLDTLYAQEAANRLSQKHASLNSGATGSQNMEQFNASLRIESDRDVWRQRAIARDHDQREQLAADAKVARQRAQEELAANNQINASRIASKADALNQGTSGSQNMSKLNASLVQQGDSEYWRTRAQMRDQDTRDALQAARITARAEIDALLAPDTTAQRHARIEQLRQRTGNTRGDNNNRNRGFQGAMAVQQIGFGMQDFSSQVMNSKNGIDGIGRGIMAVSNNVQMLGAAFGPVGLAVTAIGGALLGIVAPMVLKWLFDTEEQDKAAKRLLDTYEKIGDRIGMIATTKNQDTATLVGTAKQLEQKKRVLEDEMKMDTEFGKQALAEQVTIAERKKEFLKKNGVNLGYVLRVDPGSGKTRAQAQAEYNDILSSEALNKPLADAAHARGQKTSDEAGRNKAEMTALDAEITQAKKYEAADKINKILAKDNPKEISAAQDDLLEKQRMLLAEQTQMRLQYNRTDNEQAKSYLRKQFDEKTEEYNKNNAVLAGIKEKALEADDKLDDAAFDKWVKHEKDRQLDKQLNANRTQQDFIKDNIDDMQYMTLADGQRVKRSTQSSGPSGSAGRGSAAAASAINAALGGNRSEEGDRAKAIRIAEGQLIEIKKLNTKLTLAKGALHSA